MGYKPLGSDQSQTKPDGASGDEAATTIYQPEILLKIGKAAMNKNDYQTAKETYEKILENNPDHQEAQFLLKRVKYMASEESSGDKNKKAKQKAKQKAKEEKKPEMRGVLPIQQLEKLKIKPKQKYKIDPHIIGPETDTVYGLEEDTEDEEEELEDISRHVARRTKGSVMKRRGVTVAFLLAIAIIVMIIVGLYWFGFLDF
jgi:tetratricopeptide (TPR) repeat protein